MPTLMEVWSVTIIGNAIAEAQCYGFGRFGLCFWPDKSEVVAPKRAAASISPQQKIKHRQPRRDMSVAVVDEL